MKQHRPRKTNVTCFLSFVDLKHFESWHIFVISGMSTEFRKLLMAMEKRGAYKKGKKAITGIKDYRAILIQDEVN